MISESNAFIADPELLKDLEKISRATHVGTDCTLFRQGDPPIGLYIVRKGLAKLTMKSGNKMILQTGVAAGSLLGLPAVIASQPYSLTAEALDGAEIGFVTREDFTDLVKTAPHLMLKVVELLAAEVRSARQALSELEPKTPSRRALRGKIPPGGTLAQQ